MALSNITQSSSFLQDQNLNSPPTPDGKDFELQIQPIRVDLIGDGSPEVTCQISYRNNTDAPIEIGHHFSNKEFNGRRSTILVARGFRGPNQSFIQVLDDIYDEDRFLRIPPRSTRTRSKSYKLESDLPRLVRDPFLRSIFGDELQEEILVTGHSPISDIGVKPAAIRIKVSVVDETIFLSSRVLEPSSQCFESRCSLFTSF